MYVCEYLSLVVGSERKRPPAYEELPDAGDGWRVLLRGRGQQQEALQEAGGPLHPPGAEETAIHARHREAQATLQETAQDHTEGGP